MDKKLSIVMPAHNEEKRIGNTLKAYSEFFNSIKESGILDYEIIVVINNTVDNTERIVLEWKKKNANIRYLNLLRGGKGYAVIEGFKDALDRENDLIGFVDADMATSPDSFYELVLGINKYDGVIASRYVKGAYVNPPPTIPRIISSRIFNILIRGLLFLPFRDTQCGAKIFRREVIEKILRELTMSQWAFDVELLYLMKKNNFIIKESATQWGDKNYSKINFMKAGPWMALGVIRLRIINSPFRSFVRIYDKLIGVIFR